MDFELLTKDPAAFWGSLIASIIVTVLVYGAFPFVFARRRNTPIKTKKYKRLCYGINIVGMIFFTIVNGEIENLGPYWLWTWIFSRNGLSVLEERGLLQDADADDAGEDPDRVVECKSCGYRNEDFFDMCPKCGKYAKQYVSKTEGVYFCKRCGKRAEETESICAKCGEKLFFDRKPAVKAEIADLDNKTVPAVKEADAVESYSLSFKEEKPKNPSLFDVYGEDILLVPTETLQATDKKEEEHACTLERMEIQFCGKCGNKLLPDSVFCDKCGTRILP